MDRKPLISCLKLAVFLKPLMCEDIRATEEFVAVVFTPTVPHCSLSTLIGLALLARLSRHFGDARKLSVRVQHHEDADKLNKQFADKERVQGGFENPEIRRVLITMTAFQPS